MSRDTRLIGELASSPNDFYESVVLIMLFFLSGRILVMTRKTTHGGVCSANTQHTTGTAVVVYSTQAN